MAAPSELPQGAADHAHLRKQERHSHGTEYWRYAQ